MKPVINPVLQAKFLQHLNTKKKGDEGFTLIELLVVVIIIGVLAAIALPSLLGQVNKAKQSEAKQNVGALNRAQQAFFLEGQVFASTVTALGIGIRTLTNNYSYAIAANSSGYGSFAQQTAIQQKTALKAYYGVVGTAVGDTTTNEALTLAIACESVAPGAGMATVTAMANPPACDGSYITLAK